MFICIHENTCIPFTVGHLHSTNLCYQEIHSLLLHSDAAILLHLKLSKVLLEVVSMCTRIQNGCVCLHDLGILCKYVECIIHIILRECLILHHGCNCIRVRVGFA